MNGPARRVRKCIYRLLQSRDYLQDPSGHFEYITLVARATGDPAALVAGIKSAVAGIDKNVPVSEIETMDQAVDDLNAQPRFELWLLASFAMVAVLLAALGIYGVMSYSVSRRTHELGVRMALGAAQQDVIKLVVRQAMYSGAGRLGLRTGRGLRAHAHDVEAALRRATGGPADLRWRNADRGAVALLASYIPARRATHIDPVTALRCE